MALLGWFYIGKHHFPFGGSLYIPTYQGNALYRFLLHIAHDLDSQVRVTAKFIENKGYDLLRLTMATG